MIRLAAAIAASAIGAALPQELPHARHRPLSPPDCAGPANLVSQSDAAPLGETYMRVQHIGDAGTEEQAQQVANAVTWDVSSVTGLATPVPAQRGYRDQGPPEPASAFQLWCGDAGFYIDSRRFRHAARLTGEGPSVSIARDYHPPLPLFADARALVMQATVRVPTLRNQSLPVVTEGTAQVSFFYYVRDRTTGAAIAHLVGLFDNRVPGTNGAGIEDLGSDGVVAFATSPLGATDARGQPVRYATWLGGETMRFAPWSEPRLFRAMVTRDNFTAMLERLRAGPLPHISPRPEDYGLILFGILGEVFPGTGDANNVALGGSVQGLRLSEDVMRPLVTR